MQNLWINKRIRAVWWCAPAVCYGLRLLRKGFKACRPLTSTSAVINTKITPLAIADEVQWVCCDKELLRASIPEWMVPSIAEEVQWTCCHNQWRTQEFCSGGEGFNNFSWEDRWQRTGIWGAVASYPLVKGCGGSCNLVQEILFHIVKFS